jgi:hypothetical protein
MEEPPKIFTRRISRLVDPKHFREEDLALNPRELIFDDFGEDFGEADQGLSDELVISKIEK